MLAGARKYAAAGCLAGLLTLVSSAPYAQTQDYLVKAAFIYNFIKFVEWPADRTISKQSSIDICLVGESKLPQAAAVFEKASTPQLRLSLVRENDITALEKHCHIAFLGESEGGKLSAILSQLKGKPVLTISDIERFAEKGGMIGFVTVGGNVKLAVNLSSAMGAGLRIDAQVLEIAVKVLRQ